MTSDNNSILIEKLPEHDHAEPAIGQEALETVEIEWFETRKRVLRKQSSLGTDISIRLLDSDEPLKHGDILFRDGSRAIQIAVKPCKVVRINPRSSVELAIACYEIGNRHLPAFLQGDAVLVPFEKPVLVLLESRGIPAEVVEARLETPINASVQPHSH